MSIGAGLYRSTHWSDSIACDGLTRANEQYTVPISGYVAVGLATGPFSSQCVHFLSLIKMTEVYGWPDRCLLSLWSSMSAAGHNSLTPVSRLHHRAVSFPDAANRNSGCRNRLNAECLGASVQCNRLSRLVAGIELTGVQKPGDHRRLDGQHFVSVSASHHPLPGQSPQQVHGGRRAVGQTAELHPAGGGVAEGGDETCCAVSTAYPPGAAIGEVFFSEIFSCHHAIHGLLPLHGGFLCWSLSSINRATPVPIRRRTLSCWEDMELIYPRGGRWHCPDPLIANFRKHRRQATTIGGCCGYTRSGYGIACASLLVSTGRIS